MRPTYMLFASAILLLPGAGFAEDYQDCKLTCAAEKETRNMRCPSSGANTEHRQCMKENEDAYDDCVNHCATPPPASEEQTPPRWHSEVSLTEGQCWADHPRSFI